MELHRTTARASAHPARQATNPGIVPPWLLQRTIPIVPGPDTPRILVAPPIPIVPGPDTPRIFAAPAIPIVPGPDTPRIFLASSQAEQAPGLLTALA